MGISFTISKKGKRYINQPKSVDEQETNEQKQEQHFHSDGPPSTQVQNQYQNQGDPTMPTSSAKAKSLALSKSTLERLEALGPSFSLNLFEDGFNFGETEEIIHDVPNDLIPYCQETDLILTDVQCGRIPTGVLQDMPLKYVNGTILCEVRDYRVFIGLPLVDTVPLKMRLDNVIEDMASMSEQLSNSDMLKFQSKVLTYLYPILNLDPTRLAFESNETIPKIDLGIGGGSKRKRTGVMTDVDSILDRFYDIDMLTRIHALAQSKPVEGPSSSITPSYSTNLISTRLNEVETDDL